jgi:hypothetical protein
VRRSRVGRCNRAFRLAESRHVANRTFSGMKINVKRAEQRSKPVRLVDPQRDSGPRCDQCGAITTIKASDSGPAAVCPACGEVKALPRRGASHSFHVNQNRV